MNTQLTSKTTVAEFVKSNKFTQISKVQLNVNNYPFITFKKIENNKPVTENIWFSKKASNLVKLDDSPKILQDLFIVEYVDEKTGLVMKKISKKGEDYYEDASEIFG